MSVVTGVVLCTSGVDEELWPRVDAWLVEHGFAALARVDEQASGTKHPQMTIGAAGFSYFPEGEFAAFVDSLQWQLPDDVVLVMRHGQHETFVASVELGALRKRVAELEELHGAAARAIDALESIGEQARRRIAELEAGLPAAWLALTDEQREQLMGLCCRGCGTLFTPAHPWCYCQADG